MANTNKPLVYLIYEDLVKAVDGIGKKTFTYRPKNSSTELVNFVVVGLPTDIYGVFKGSTDVLAECYGTYSVFCKAKTDATVNVGMQSDIVQKVIDLFPINGKHVSASSPRILMQGEDGYGYHVTQITFSLRTKVNARNID